MDNMRPLAAPVRALLIGGGAGDAERLAARLGPGAQVICFAASRASSEEVRRAIVARAPGARVAVMLGDPALLVHKVSGPFDIVVDAHPGGEERRARLRSLTGERGKVNE